ncbi:MAG TPA: rhodanese-like domain-containing protein [Patescibacteria group bacterium]|nr:rhodanese-like domain-containing protein [Patescibacteria group bacterium]
MKLVRVFAVALSWLVLPVSATTPLPGVVVSAQWLKEHRAEVVVLDVRSDLDLFTTAPEYATDPKSGAKVLASLGGHIPGARLVDFEKTRVSRIVDGKKIDKMLPAGVEIEALMRALGVNRGDALVITAQNETFDEFDMAARLYWSLKTYGHRDMALLDGGNAAWLAAGYEISTAAPGPLAAGDWQASALDDAWLAEMNEIQPGKRAPTLVDARPLPQYLGLFHKKPAVAAAGHVRGAVNFPPDIQTRQNGRAQMFMSPAQYRDVLADVGVTPKRGAIVYCNTGHMAAGAWFVLSEIMGVDKVRLYDGSMHEWTTFGRPLVSSVN